MLVVGLFRLFCTVFPGDCAAAPREAYRRPAAERRRWSIPPCLVPVQLKPVTS